MGKIVFGMMQSLDGYVAGIDGALEPPLHAPGAALFRYWIDYVRGLADSLYGRRMYEVMRYWDDDRPEWGASEREFATVWRAQPEMGRFTFAAADRPQRRARRRRSRRPRSPAEGGGRRCDRRRGARSGGRV